MNRWTEILKKEYEPEKIILFGSFADKKGINEWSDIDLIIIKNTDKSFLNRIKEILILLKPKVGGDILVYTPGEFKNLCSSSPFFKSEVVKKGILIYERENN